MKYIIKASFLMIALFIFSCNNRENRSKRVKEIAEDYSIRIDSLIKTTSPRFFNGVILITKNGETKYLKEYGYSDFENKTPISIEDKFRIMSNSKQVTAVLILKEVENGKIDLQTPIRAYLPNLSHSWADTVTVHHLLNMSSGIVGIERPLIFEPGNGYRYSNPGYGLLGRIIEKVSGKTYIQAANDLFIELGMNNTYCYEIDKHNGDLVKEYNLKGGELSLIEFDNMGETKESWKDFIPAGGIISTARDLNTWDTKLYKGLILNADYQKMMTTPSNRGPHAAFDNDTIGYAYGLRVHDQHPTPHIGHGGRGFGFVCIKFYVPEKDVDVIIWENIYCRDPDAIAGSPDVITGNIVYYFENKIRKIVLNSSLVK
ncbi:serine hydrolase domain-containing protein [Aureibaculum conchae]|uniref:serine hydrolase domain-containing protein n=1 Tax=Aureibaculum sp. 2308TA14-22 TaxID=3108392 RepID=UPI0033996B1A